MIVIRIDERKQHSGTPNIGVEVEPGIDDLPDTESGRMARTMLAAAGITGSGDQESWRQTIGSSGWQAVRVPISDGFHTLSCSQDCTVMVHGYDQYVSYGYPGGLNLFECIEDDHCLLPSEPYCNPNFECQADVVECEDDDGCPSIAPSCDNRFKCV